MGGGAVNEVQAQWRAHRSELRDEHEDLLRRVERGTGGSDRGATRKTLQDHDFVLQRLEEAVGSLDHQMRTLLARDQARDQAPPWFGQLEAATAGLERRLEEQRAWADAQFGRARHDLDSFVVRIEGLQSLRAECTEVVDRRIGQEVERLERAIDAAVEPQRVHAPERNFADSKAIQDAGRRLDDSEAKLAALRVRLDAHDGRFASVGERAETACQQAVECARQAALQQREEILQEADCQLRILRQRVEALAEVCDELTLRETSRARPSPTRLAGAQSTRTNAVLRKLGYGGPATIVEEGEVDDDELYRDSGR